MSKEGRTGELEAMYADMAKRFGKGIGLPITQQPRVQLVRYSTGSVMGDWATGGGIPQGRIIEIYGPESSGKTSLALSVMASVQGAGHVAAMIDAEQTYDPDWARTLGVDPDAVPTMQPDTGEDALDAVELMVRSKAVQLIVVDSVAALVPRAELEGAMGDAHMGLQARLMSQACRKLGPLCRATNCTVVFINQLRMKIGVTFGNPEVTSGGNALKFYASIRVEVRGGQPIKDHEEQIGHYINLKVPKNKTAPPKKKCSVPFLYSLGLDKVREVLDVAAEQGIISKSGAWYNYGDVRLGQGAENATSYIRERPELMTELRAAVMQAIMGVDEE